MRKLLTPRELAAILGVKPATIYGWVKARMIPHITISRGRRKSTVRFRESEIESWLRQRRQKKRRGTH